MRAMSASAPSGAAAAGEGAAEAHRHRLAKGCEPRVHLGRDRAGMGARGAVGGPERGEELGAVFANREALPDGDAAVLEIGHEAGGGTGLDLRRDAAGEADHFLGDVEAGYADGEPAAQAPGGMAAGSDDEAAFGHGGLLARPDHATAAGGRNRTPRALLSAGPSAKPPPFLAEGGGIALRYAQPPLGRKRCFGADPARGRMKCRSTNAC